MLRCAPHSTVVFPAPNETLLPLGGEEPGSRGVWKVSWEKRGGKLSGNP
jgi:hypothetical protein